MRRTEKCNWMCWILHRKYCNPWINKYNTYPILFTLLQINTNAHVFDMYLLSAMWIWAKVSTFCKKKIVYHTIPTFMTYLLTTYHPVIQNKIPYITSNLGPFLSPYITFKSNILALWRPRPYIYYFKIYMGSKMDPACAK